MKTQIEIFSRRSIEVFIRTISIISITLILSISAFSQDFAGNGISNEQSKENIAKGRGVYNTSCSYCHGLSGKGDGPAADFLIPAPRDFTSGEYKYRRTPSGIIPTDWDLFDRITKGVHGTSMINWADLPEEKRWQLVYYIKTFSDKFKDEPNPSIIKVGVPPEPTIESLSRGRQFYIDAECWKCHGLSGRGDGPSADELLNNKGEISIPRDLTVAKNYGRGSSQRSIYLTLLSGLDGTPMPSYSDAFEDMDEELWDLVNYIYSLSNRME